MDQSWFSKTRHRGSIRQSMYIISWHESYHEPCHKSCYEGIKSHLLTILILFLSCLSPLITALKTKSCIFDTFEYIHTDLLYGRAGISRPSFLMSRSCYDETIWPLIDPWWHRCGLWLNSSPTPPCTLLDKSSSALFSPVKRARISGDSGLLMGGT